MIADDRDPYPSTISSVQHGHRVEQTLRRMLVHAVAGVDDGHVEMRGEEPVRAGVRMAHHDHVGADAFDGPAGIDQRLALLDARAVAVISIVVAPSALAANSNEVRVRVESRRTAVPRLCRVISWGASPDSCAGETQDGRRFLSASCLRCPARNALLFVFLRDYPFHQQHFVGLVGLLQFTSIISAGWSGWCGRRSWLRSAIRGGRGR